MPYALGLSSHCNTRGVSAGLALVGTNATHLVDDVCGPRHRCVGVTVWRGVRLYNRQWQQLLGRHIPLFTGHTRCHGTPANATVTTPSKRTSNVPRSAMLSHISKSLEQKHTAISPEQVPWKGGTSPMFSALHGLA